MDLVEQQPKNRLTTIWGVGRPYKIHSACAKKAWGNVCGSDLSFLAR